MVRRNKLILKIIIISVAAVCLVAVGILLSVPPIRNSLDNYREDLKTRFSGFTPDDNVVVVWHDHSFYFTDHDLKLWKITEKKEEIKDDGYLFWNNKVYFVAYKGNGWFKNYSLLIYECDMYGNNKKLLFEKEYNESLSIAGNCDTFFLKFENTIDTYNIQTGVYKTLATGNDLDLSDYINKEEKYTWKRNDGNVITVTDTQQKTSYTINDTMLRDSELGAAIDGLDYEFHSVQIVDDHIYMMYRIEPHFFLFEQPFFVCEYDPSTNNLSFKTFVYAEEYTQITIDHKIKE